MVSDQKARSIGHVVGYLFLGLMGLWVVAYVCGW